MTAATTTSTTYPAYTTPTGLTTAISRTLKAEWTKFHTLPSTWRMTVMAIVTSIGLGAILCASQASQWATMSASQRRSFDPTACSLGGVFLVGVALLASLAVRSVTAEYATGMIRSTFTATPARRLVLAAKAAVSAAFVFPVVLLCNLLSFEAGQRVFAAKHLQVSFAHPGVLQAIIFGAVGVSLVAILGVGLGGIIRHTAGATTAVIMVIVGGVTLGQFLPAGLRQYLPGTALEAAVTVHRSPGLLRPGTAIIVLGIYAAIALAAASIRVAHRDA
jgi:ABC-2 type transport system permease protein